jgi:hypothetical protein
MAPGYASKLGREECELLAGLIGRPLASISTDGFAVEIETAADSICIEPCTTPTPDSEHPIAGVSRPMVVAGPRRGALENWREVGRDLGAVRAVLVHATLVKFCVPRTVPETTIGAATIPEGIAYEPVFSQPDEGDGDVDLDIAVEIRTDEHEALVYTDGTGMFVTVRLDGGPAAGWERRGRPVQQVARRRL